MTESPSPQKAAFITGASRGLGRSLAQHLSGQYQLGLGCHQNPVPDLPHSISIPADLSSLKKNPSRNACTLMLETFGRVDLFVANAGIVEKGLAVTTSEESWDRIFSVNLNAVFQGLQAFEEPLKRTNGSAVIIGSLAGIRGAAGASVYSAAKAALIGMVRSVAREWAPHARINLVIPGYLDTDMGLAYPEARKRARDEDLFPDTDHISQTCALIEHLAEMRGISGQIFFADSRIDREW